ncbi:hypothetical protein NC651_004860 [Populus alba x Populus x berolinensis]|nr:hypothetical protein NC651_004860 [Populus alba x Populus x berolinensis]
MKSLGRCILHGIKVRDKVDHTDCSQGLAQLHDRSPLKGPNLIDIRKHQDIHSRSSIKIFEAQPNLYSAIIGEKVCMKIGDGSWCPAVRSGRSQPVATDTPCGKNNPPLSTPSSCPQFCYFLYGEDGCRIYGRGPQNQKTVDREEETDGYKSVIERQA